MDAFSEILAGLKLRGAFYFHAEFSAPWGVTSPVSSQLAAVLAPGEPQLVIYHLLVHGKARARLANGDIIRLSEGDILVVPHGEAHELISEGRGEVPRDTNVRSEDVVAKVVGRDLTPLCAGGGGEKTRFICGFMACDRYLSQPVLQGLPTAFRVNIRADQSGQWLEKSIHHLADSVASGVAGSQAMLAKLSEALFVDTLRRFVASLPETQIGWLAGARDQIVGKALAKLHNQPEHDWTIAELAKLVGMSRSALVERFSKYLEMPPMAYLAHWRLQLAARALTTTSRGTSNIAADVGYESEAAFNRAFKRQFGLPPARYRREYKQASVNSVLQ
jgi:AraC-like DNA-binding protein